MANASADRPDFRVRNGSGYMLGHDYTSSCRLNLQFYLWKEALKFNLHPDVNVTEHQQKDFGIADVGSGTAIWLIDLAHELPHARLEGFDINNAQAPPQAWLPKNVVLHELDILKELPSHLYQAFDVVHLRLFLLVVENSDPTPIIANVAKMLKPGGWLQWDEVDPNGHKLVRASACTLGATPALDKYCDMVFAGGKHGWMLHLPQTLQEHGFIKGKSYRYHDPDSLVKMNSDQHMMTVAEFAAKLQDMGREKEAAETYRMVNEANAECSHGIAYNMPRIITVAQKRS